MGNILVLYHSQEYGNTGAMAQAVAEGARAAGADVTLVNTNEERLDLERYRRFDAVAFGTPDYWSYVEIPAPPCYTWRTTRLCETVEHAPYGAPQRMKIGRRRLLAEFPPPSQGGGPGG